MARRKTILAPNLAYSMQLHGIGAMHHECSVPEMVCATCSQHDLPQVVRVLQSFCRDMLPAAYQEIDPVVLAKCRLVQLEQQATLTTRWRKHSQGILSGKAFCNLCCCTLSQVRGKPAGDTAFSSACYSGRLYAFETVHIAGNYARRCSIPPEESFYAIHS